MVWKGFSLDWYAKLFRNRLIMQSVYTTLLVSLLATVIATVAGNLRRHRLLCHAPPGPGSR